MTFDPFDPPKVPAKVIYKIQEEIKKNKIYRQIFEDLSLRTNGKRVIPISGFNLSNERQGGKRGYERLVLCQFFDMLSRYGVGRRARDTLKNLDHFYLFVDYKKLVSFVLGRDKEELSYLISEHEFLPAPQSKITPVMKSEANRMEFKS